MGYWGAGKRCGSGPCFLAAACAACGALLLAQPVLRVPRSEVSFATVWPERMEWGGPLCGFGVDLVLSVSFSDLKSFVVSTVGLIGWFLVFCRVYSICLFLGLCL